MSSIVATGPSGDKPFEYVTLTGNVIRSVVPPGKGNVNYKVNQGGYARPYGAAPPAAAPKSPVTYPPQPQQQWNQPPPTQPKPAGGNAYATLPRSNVGQQEANQDSLQPQYAECYFEEDDEVEEVNRQQRSKFCWPPAEDDSHRAPTAAPLYIPPPETQHVVAKQLENPAEAPTSSAAVCGQCQCNEFEQEKQQQQSQWQSRSAPLLTAGMAAQHHQEFESSSDSYTSTSTTTTTTSEEYQRMYAAQIQAYQMQQAYEQSGSEFDYHMDMEVAAVQEQNHLQHSSLHNAESGRRSAQECIETLVPPLSTYKLVDMVREVTPSPVPEPSQSSRHVVFLEDPEMREEQRRREEQVQQQQQTTSSTYASNLTQAANSSQVMAYEKAEYTTTSAKVDAHKIIEEITDELEHSEVLFPPPSPLSHLKPRPPSGLHRPESIPKYQRNWTVLPTQSPVRTPEPQELRENIPLAFVDTPKTPTTNCANGNTVHRPVAQMSARTVNQQQSQSQQQQTTAAAYSSSAMKSTTEQRQQQMSSTVTSSTTTASNCANQQLQLTKPTIPIIVEDRTGPVSMAFQALDEHMVRDQSQTPSRPYTPSMINKPAPITPYYQTAEKLCFDECPATHARDYNRRSASPFPDRTKSPAPGPPPNPLAAIRAPRIKENEVSPLSQRVLQAGSITTGQSYLGAQHAQQQERLLSHTATGIQSEMQTYTEQPEKREKMQIGNMTMERSEKASHLEEQQQRQMQSHTTTQVGNTQIERRRKVTEAFEHTSSAKTVELRTDSQSSTERRQSYGKTGFVVNQAKRLSGLEQEISNLTSQSQAISARAATMSDTKFPELANQGSNSMFPTKPVLPPHDEPQPPNYYVYGTSKNKSSEPASTVFPPVQQKQPTTTCAASLVSSQKSLSVQQQQQQQKSLTTLSSYAHQQQANTVSSNLTKASATICTNNQAYQSITAGSNLNATSTSSATGTTPANVCPITGTFCRPGHTCCKQQIIDQDNNNDAPLTASLGLAGHKPSPATNIIANMQSAAAAAPAPTASKTQNATASSNNDNNDSATGGMAPKGGAYGATSAPKRGRGILNKAVSPGVRVPLCNSCGTHIRGPFITALGKIWCPEHFHCVNGNCRRPLQDIGFVEEKGDLYCEYCFEKYLAPTCSKCSGKIKGDCLNAIGKHFHPECFACGHCGKLFGNTPFFLEDGMPYCEADWNELFTTKCFACGFPVEAGDRWVEALNHNYHSQCFNCTYCKQNLEGQSFYNKGGRPFCKNHAR